MNLAWSKNSILIYAIKLIIAFCSCLTVFFRALNYGAIGTILGHELTHGFDNSGTKAGDPKIHSNKLKVDIGYFSIYRATI